MEEYLNQEIVPAEPVSYDSLLGKWFHFLLPVQIAGVVLTVLSGFQLWPTLLSLAGHGVGICVIVALFHMAPANGRYKTAAILRCVSVGGGLLSLIAGGSLFALAVSVCSIISAYQEYKGHSEIVAEKDAKLSHKWNALFIWQLVVGLLTGFLTTVISVIGVLTGISLALLVSVVLIATTVVSACVQVFYLMYLKKMQLYFPV